MDHFGLSLKDVSAVTEIQGAGNSLTSLSRCRIIEEERAPTMTPLRDLGHEKFSVGEPHQNLEAAADDRWGVGTDNGIAHDRKF